MVAVNNVVDQTTGSVLKLAYVNGVIWQENTAQLWWSKTSPQSSWAPPNGISTPPASITMRRLSTSATFVIDGTTTQTLIHDGASVRLTSPGVANVTMGATSDSLSFIGMKGITLTAGSAATTVTANGGSNSFTSGKASLVVTGGPGPNAYFYNAGNATLTIKDFSLVAGDSLNISKSLQGSLKETSDGHGGVNLSFGGTSQQGIHILSVPTVAPTSIHWN